MPATDATRVHSRSFGDLSADSKVLESLTYQLRGGHFRAEFFGYHRYSRDLETGFLIAFMLGDSSTKSK